MSSLYRARRHWMALPALLLVGLVGAGAVYAAAAPAGASTADPNDFTPEQVQAGRDLFLANCSTCHGFNGEGGDVDENGKISGPSLIGVGAASVDFQVGTGRMPLQRQEPQAPQRAPQFSQEETRLMAAYVASLGPGPGIPDDEFLAVQDDAESITRGSEIFRVNCAMCHNFVGKGGALTEGKYAPEINTEPVHTYEAMLTGPQNMPVFGDGYMPGEDKQDIISYLASVQDEPSPGGLDLGGIGPVSEGLVAWVVGIGGLIGCAVWLGAKAS